MKAIIISAIFAICFHGLFAQNPGSIFYAVVNGNQVSIHQDNAHHNCGFLPGLENVTITDSIINWYQIDTLGISYGCTCYFDYSVSIDSLNPGNYTVMVYSVFDLSYGTSTIYEGTTSFSIGGQTTCNNNFQLSSNASECHEYTGLKIDPPMDVSYVIVHNANGLSIRNKGSGKIIKVVLSNLSGQVVLKNAYSASSEIQLSASSLKKGVYVISIYDERNTIENRKVVIF